MEQKITINGTEKTLKVTARTPIIYKNFFPKRDLLLDFSGGNRGTDSYDSMTKLLYVELVHAGEACGKYEEWLDSFDEMPLDAMKAATNFWTASTGTSVENNKKKAQQTQENPQEK